VNNRCARCSRGPLVTSAISSRADARPRANISASVAARKFGCRPVADCL
jgi:hypothetical protein